MSFIRRNIPNAITCANLLCGCVALVYIGHDALYIASWFVLGAAVADFFDGLAARALKVNSPIGKELDSLADVVSFGVVPGMMLLKLIHNPYLCWIGLLVPVFGAIRLARFNIDDKQTTYFVGLPIPANALFIISFPLIIRYHIFWQEFYLANADFANYFFAGISVICSALMVAHVRLFSMKMKDMSWANNKIRYILVVLSVVALALFAYQALPIIMVLYVILSMVENQLSDPSTTA